MSFAHPSPGPHPLTDPSSARSTRAPGIASKLLMLVLLILAVAATVIMFFVDSEFWVNLAVIAALWAAFIGAVLVSRYSGAIADEDSRIEALDARYQAELDAERAEHRRREVELENSYAAYRDAGRDETLESIRSELAAMREQLADLSGLDLSDEQVAVRARAERIIELERRSSQVGSSVEADAQPAAEEPAATIPPDSSAARISEPRQGSRRGGFATGTFSAVRWSGADSQDTAMIPLVVDTNTDDADLDSGNLSDSSRAHSEPAQASHRGTQEAPFQPAQTSPISTSGDSDESADFSVSSRESEVVSMPQPHRDGASGSHRNEETHRGSGSERPSHDGSTSRRARQGRNHRTGTPEFEPPVVTAETAHDVAAEAIPGQVSGRIQDFAAGPAKPAEPTVPVGSVEPGEPVVPVVEEPHHRRRANDDAPDNVHGRRRVEERDDAGAVTVAELMAQLKKNSQ